jgi:hypothetical protein
MPCVTCSPTRSGRHTQQLVRSDDSAAAGRDINAVRLSTAALPWRLPPCPTSFLLSCSRVLAAPRRCATPAMSQCQNHQQAQQHVRQSQQRMT